jgi:hypothetical protein
MRALLSAAAILLACASASAQERELIIAGAGASPCATVLKMYREGPKAAGLLLIYYAQGFWSSQNAMFLQAGTPMLKNLGGDSRAQLEGLMAECERKPSQDFGIIVRDYFHTLPSMRNPRPN